MRLTAGTTASERDPRSVKSDDDVQSTLSNNGKKGGDDDDGTQHDDSNVSTESVHREAFTAWKKHNNKSTRAEDTGRCNSPLCHLMANVSPWISQCSNTLGAVSLQRRTADQCVGNGALMVHDTTLLLRTCQTVTWRWTVSQRRR